MKRLTILILLLIVIFFAGCATQVKKDWVCISVHTTQEAIAPNSTERTETYQERCMPKTIYEQHQKAELSSGGSDL